MRMGESWHQGLRTWQDSDRALLLCKLVNSCFFSEHFRDFETPHPTSFLGHLLPKGEGRVFPTLSRGERVSAMCRGVRGQSTNFGCGRQAALRYPLIKLGKDQGSRQ